MARGEEEKKGAGEETLALWRRMEVMSRMRVSMALASTVSKHYTERYRAWAGRKE